MSLDSKQKSRTSLDTSDYATLLLNSATAVPIPNTPSSLLPQAPRPPAEKDDGGPYKAEMVGRMEHLQRGDRVLPPCDRCRRLHMDCLKNLTACMGCTKKHAKCAWREVEEEEMLEGREEHAGSDGHGEYHDPPVMDKDARDHQEQEQALREEESVRNEGLPGNSSANEAEKAPSGAVEDKAELSVHETAKGGEEEVTSRASAQDNDGNGHGMDYEMG